ncbi:hypothetical protein SK128_004089 [Halocaridina rubra]|uniref:Uncharacterized protein n=1 Tax=Halocaridina rubra TaxID=373956 RepID=A0AAN9A368_HALRR
MLRNVNQLLYNEGLHVTSPTGISGEKLRVGCRSVGGDEGSLYLEGRLFLISQPLGGRDGQAAMNFKTTGLIFLESQPFSTPFEGEEEGINLPPPLGRGGRTFFPSPHPERRRPREKSASLVLAREEEKEGYVLSLPPPLAAGGGIILPHPLAGGGWLILPPPPPGRRRRKNKSVSLLLPKEEEKKELVFSPPPSLTGEGGIILLTPLPGRSSKIFT